MIIKTIHFNSVQLTLILKPLYLLIAAELDLNHNKFYKHVVYVFIK